MHGKWLICCLSLAVAMYHFVLQPQDSQKWIYHYICHSLIQKCIEMPLMVSKLWLSLSDNCMVKEQGITTVSNSTTISWILLGFLSLLEATHRCAISDTVSNKEFCHLLNVFELKWNREANLPIPVKLFLFG